MPSPAQMQGFTFTFSLSDMSTTFRGADGRTGSRETPLRVDSEPPGPSAKHVLSRDGKRAERKPKQVKKAKRPVGRPRKHPLPNGAGLAIELGSFVRF